MLAVLSILAVADTAQLLEPIGLQQLLRSATSLLKSTSLPSQPRIATHAIPHPRLAAAATPARAAAAAQLLERPVPQAYGGVNNTNALSSAPPTFPKRGTSGLSHVTCSDASALNLANTWTYNWGIEPDGTHAACKRPQVAEFVPMIWGCWGNCTSTVTPAVRERWTANGVTHLLGFNEPDNKGQSNLTPTKAALYWKQLDAFASTFSPPLKLVGPGLTHWGKDGSSPWLEQFLGNLSTAMAARIVAFAQHDYSGNAQGIIDRSTALYTKYKRKVWLTEFSVGSGKDRATNDAFARKVLPLLDASDAVERYAWFSTRNTPSTWVAQSSLLPPALPAQGGWTKISQHTCAADEMLYLSQHGSAAVCLAHAVDDNGCAAPKTAIYQSGDVKNCYCANTTTCTETSSSWQDLYTVKNGTIAAWPKKGDEACAGDAMLFLSQHGSILACETMALLTPACTAVAGVEGVSKEVFYESGDVKNCYCANSTTVCAPNASTWLVRYTQPGPPEPSMALTSTGKLYSTPRN